MPSFDPVKVSLVNTHLLQMARAINELYSRLRDDRLMIKV